MAYKRFEAEDIVLSSENVSTPIWSDGSIKLNSGSWQVDTAQVTSLSGRYYYNVELKVSEGVEPVQFAITYANVSGSTTNLDEDTSRVIYGQYRSLILGDEEESFYLTNSTGSSEDFYVITVDRARFKERLMLNTLKLNIKGADRNIVLTDDSSISGNVVRYIDSGRVYNLVEVNSNNEIIDSGEKYGWMLPDIGVILLDRQKCFGNTIDGMSFREKMEFFFESLDSIEIQAAETITSNYIFVRVRNSEFNYSINPSNIGDSGELIHDVMINSPQAFITTVGLYNDGGDLLAVAKLSRPLLKDFTKEALIRVKLDY